MHVFLFCSVDIHNMELAMYESAMDILKFQHHSDFYLLDCS